MNKVLKLADIRLDGDTQVRLEISQFTVQQYAEAMKLGAEFKPMVVYFDGTDYWLANGFHRYHAYKSNGVLESNCEVVEGDLEEAQFFAIGANGTNGLRPTPADNRNGVFKLLDNPKRRDMSNNAIAKHMNISAMTVGRYRKEWEERNNEPPKTEVTYTRDGETKTMRIDRHREKKPMEQRYAEELPVPPPMTKEEELDLKLSEMTHLLKETIEENEQLRDAVATGQFDGSEIEKIDIEDTIRELREQVRLKDIEIQSLRESRDTYQNRAAELMKQVKVLQNKLKKAGIE